MRKKLLHMLGLAAFTFILSTGMTARPLSAQATTQAQAGMGCGDQCEAYWSDWMQEWHWWCGYSGDAYQYCERSTVFDCNDSTRCYFAQIQNSEGEVIELAKFCTGERESFAITEQESYLLDGEELSLGLTGGSGPPQRIGGGS